MGSAENAARLLNGQLPEGVPQEIAAKTAKFVGYKAPLALRIANEIIDEQVGKSIEHLHHHLIPNMQIGARDINFKKRRIYSEKEYVKRIKKMRGDCE